VFPGEEVDEGVSFTLKTLNTPQFPSSFTSFNQHYLSSNPMAESFNFVSTAAAARKIPPLQEPSPEKVASVTLIETRDLEIALDSTRGRAGGSGARSAAEGGRPATPKAGRPPLWPAGPLLPGTGPRFRVRAPIDLLVSFLHVPALGRGRNTAQRCHLIRRRVN
jgi:hypothetical protein